MNTSLLQQLTLYRFRYIVAYSLVGFFLVGLLLADLSSVPNGVRASEQVSAVASNSLNPLAPRLSDVINLPYHLLQKFSIGMFGLSPLTIRLPSVVLGVISAIVLGVALHQWFRRNIATIALLIAVTSTPFIAMSRSGTAGVLYMLLLLIIMLGASKLTSQGTRHPFLWKFVVIASGLLLFYMPLGVYAVLTMIVAGIFHPHVRYQIKRTKLWQFATIGLLGVVLLAPVAIASWYDIHTLETLFGINDLPAKLVPTALGASTLAVFKTLGQFYQPHIADIIVPFVDLTFALMILFGLARTIIDRHAARSYLLHLWIIIAIPLLILNPSSFPLLFVPCVFLMAIGFETLLREWYQVFPLNPYARLGALVPITLIIVGMIAVSTTRYFYGFYYTDTRADYDPSLTAVKQVLKGNVKTQLIVPGDKVSFYDILRSKNPNLTVNSPENEVNDKSTKIVLASVGSHAGTPSHIVTSVHKNDGVLLRVYEQ